MMIPIVLTSISYVVGILWGLYLSLSLGIALFVLLLCLNQLMKKIENLKLILLGTVFILSIIYTKSYYQKAIIKTNESKIETTAQIISEIVETGYGKTCIIKLKEGYKAKAYINNNDIEYGQEIKISGKQERPSGKRNEGGFDYRKYLYSKGIYAVIYAQETEILKPSKENIIHQIKRSIEETYLKLFPKNHAGIIMGMTIGEVNKIEEETKENFKTTGITHLLAVSGGNVAYIIVATMFVFKKIAGRNISNIITILAIIMFTLISGASSSVIRAAIMAIITIIGELLARKPNIYASMSLAALIILVYNPLTIWDIGFVLSFGGTIGIALLNGKIKDKFKIKLKNKILKTAYEITITTISAQIVLLPILVYNYNTLSIISIISNVLIIPIAGIVTIVGLIIYIIGIIYMPFAKILSYSIYVIIEIVIKIVKLLGNLPFAEIIIPTPNIFTIIVFYLAIYVIFFAKNKKKLVAIISILSIIILANNILPRNYGKINIIDVGQGDSIYIETSNRKTVLIDGGGSEGNDRNVGKQIVIPYILDQGKRKIDLIISTHPHADHIEGIIEIVKTLEVGKIIISKIGSANKEYDELKKVAKENEIEIVEVINKNKIEIDDLVIEIKGPKEGNKENLNNESLIVRVKMQDTKILFMGDAENEEEQALNNDIKADIIKVGHHGSNTSTSEELLQKVKPQIALISVGQNNKYKHPSKEIIENLENERIKIYRTDKNGEIQIKIYKRNQIKIKTLIDE